MSLAEVVQVQFCPTSMRASIRILSGVAIAIVACFTGAIVVAITLALAEMYMSRHGIDASFLIRQYSRGPFHMSGADMIFISASVAFGALAMGIWLFATKTPKAERAAFSGAGLITGADKATIRQNPRRPLAPQ
jgi:hypothetical protein